MNTFEYYKHLRKSAIRTLINARVPVREAYNKLRKNMDYLFNGKKWCDQYDSMNSYQEVNIIVLIFIL